MVSVLVIVSPPANPITISVSPANVSLSALQTQIFTATVSNAANLSVTWVWPAQGHLTDLPNNQVLYTAPASLTGTQTIQLRAISNQDTRFEASAAITLVSPAAAPSLSLDKTTLSFETQLSGPNPASQSITISNSGTGTLNWTASHTQPWLSLSAASGSAPGNMVVTVNASGLQPSKYNDVITVSGNAGNAPLTVPVSLSVRVADACQQSSVMGWQNTPFQEQTTSFEVRYEATPLGANISAVTGLSATPAAAISDLAVITRFAPDGTIDAMNGSSYQKNSVIWYQPGVTYRFRLVVFPAYGTYYVYVAPPNEAEVPVALGFNFKSGQASVTRFSNWVLFSDGGSHSVCNFILIDSRSRRKGTFSIPNVELTISDTLPLDATIQATYEGDDVSAVASWKWTITQSATGSSRAAKRTAVGQDVHAQTTSRVPQLSLTGYALAAGPCTIRVEALDSFGNVLDFDQAVTTLVSANGLTGHQVYPNPWRKDKHTGQDITFSGLNADTTLKIFTVSGFLVREITGGTTMAWDLKNDRGDKVVSGLYIYLLTDRQGSKVKGKVVVIR